MAKGVRAGVGKPKSSQQAAEARLILTTIRRCVGLKDKVLIVRRRRKGCWGLIKLAVDFARFY